MATSYDVAVKIAGKVDPSLIASSKKASGLISSIVKADLIASSLKTAAGYVKSFVTDSVKSYATFEQSLANAGAIAGATTEELKQMKDAAMQAGKTTQFTAAQSADALGYMALAGWDTQTSIQALQPVLKMAQATGADLATTSDQVTDSMSAMGISVNQLNDYLDVLVTTNNKSNTTASALMEAMIGAGSASKAAGLDYKQTATALGILANNGVKGAEAGTALNSMLSRMTSNQAALKAYKQLGVQVFDANGKIRDFSTILKETDTQLSKLSDEKRAAIIKDIAGVNYGGQYQFLLKGVRAIDGQASEWEKLKQNIDNAGGSLDKMNAKTTDTMMGAWARFTSAIDGARLALIDKFAPQIKVALDYVSNNLLPMVTRGIETLTTKMIEIGGAIAPVIDIIIKSAISIGGAIAPVISYFSDLGQVVQDITGFYTEHQTAIDLIGIAIGGLTVAIIAYNKALIIQKLMMIKSSAAFALFAAKYYIVSAASAVATAATTAFGTAMAFVTSPIFLVIAAITAVVAAAYLLWKNWDKVTAFLKKAWDGVCSFIGSAMKKAGQILSNIWNSVKNAFSAVGGAISGAWQGVCSGLSGAWDWVAGKLSGGFNLLGSAWDGICSGLSTAWDIYCQGLSTVWGWISGVLSAGFDGLKSGWDVFCSFFSSVFDGACKLASSYFEWLKNSFSTIVETAKKVFNGIIDFIKNVFSGNWEGALNSLTGIFSNIFEGLKSIAMAPLNWIIDKINFVIRSINGIAIPDWVPGLGGMSIDIPEIPTIGETKNQPTEGEAGAMINSGLNAILNAPKMASGGIVDRPTLAIIGEGRETEAVIPLSKLSGLLNQRTAPQTQSMDNTIKSFLDRPAIKSQNYTGGSVTFSPVINVTGGQSATAEIKQAVAMSFEQFKRMMAQYENDRRRRAFSGY